MLPSITDPSFQFDFRRWWPHALEWAPLAGALVNGAKVDSPPKMEMGVNVIGLPAIAEGVEDIGVTGGAVGSRRDMTSLFASPNNGLFSHPLIAWTKLLIRSVDVGNTTMEFGIELGSFLIAPPFAATAIRDVIQLFTDGAGTWKLRINNSVGPVLSTDTLVGVDAGTSTTGTYHVMIVWEPTSASSGTVSAYINGVLGFQKTNNIPQQNKKQGHRLGVYACHQGAAVAGTAWFLNPTVLTAGIFT